MAAALEALADLDAERRTAVLGPMAELGPDAEAEHRRMAELARPPGDPPGGGRHRPVRRPRGGRRRRWRARSPPWAILGPDDAVLVKGSRVAGLERLAQRLLEA